MINNSMEDIKNYQMIKLTDGTLLVGKIIQTVQLGDNKYLKVKNPLELKSNTVKSIRRAISLGLQFFLQ